MSLLIAILLCLQVSTPSDGSPLEGDVKSWVDSAPSLPKGWVVTIARPTADGMETVVSLPASTDSLDLPLIVVRALDQCKNGECGDPSCSDGCSDCKCSGGSCSGGSCSVKSSTSKTSRRSFFRRR